MKAEWKSIEIDGKRCYLVSDVYNAMHVPEPPPEQMKGNPNFIEFEGAFYLNPEIEIPDKPPKELSEFDKVLKGIMSVPKPK